MSGFICCLCGRKRIDHLNDLCQECQREQNALASEILSLSETLFTPCRKDRSTLAQRTKRREMDRE